MATLYITEYRDMATDSNGSAVQVGAEPAVASQTRSISGTSAQSTAFSGTTHFVELHTDVTCHIVFGDDPTATTSNKRLPADSTQFFGVPPGLKVAVIVAA